MIKDGAQMRVRSQARNRTFQAKPRPDKLKATTQPASTIADLDVPHLSKVNRKKLSDVILPRRVVNL